MKQQDQPTNNDFEYFFVPDASIGGANYPLGIMSESAAIKAAQSRGPGHLYRRIHGEKNFQLWMPIKK